jgi:23S rRNA pseudouridine955/2504/2580 synthase
MPSDGKDVSPGPAAVSYIDVTEDEAGQRIDNYLLARLKGVPKSFVYRILRSGEVRINSKRVEASRRVAGGDHIRIPPVRVAEREEDIPAPHFKMPVLFEDEHLLALDKPSGIAVHGGSGVAHGVIESLRAMRPEAKFLELVHRLDRETSGVLLVAKKRSSLTALHEMMRSRSMDKRYLVGVSGRFRNELQRVRLALAKRVTAEGEKRVSVSEAGQEAETVFRRIERGADFSLLEAELLTGRTHQIRVHLAHLKHPVLGDDKYGDFELNKALRKQGLKRMFLHARSLAFTHPASGATLTLESPLPKDLEEFRRRRISPSSLPSPKGEGETAPSPLGEGDEGT